MKRRKHKPPPDPRMVALLDDMTRGLLARADDEDAGDEMGAYAFAAKMLRDFANDVLKNLPSEPTRRLNGRAPERIAQLVKDYDAAKRGQKTAVLVEYERMHALKDKTAIRSIRNWRRLYGSRFKHLV